MRGTLFEPFLQARPPLRFGGFLGALPRFLGHRRGGIIGVGVFQDFRRRRLLGVDGFGGVLCGGRIARGLCGRRGGVRRLDGGVCGCVGAQLVVGGLIRGGVVPLDLWRGFGFVTHTAVIVTGGAAG